MIGSTEDQGLLASIAMHTLSLERKFRRHSIDVCNANARGSILSSPTGSSRALNPSLHPCKVAFVGI